MISSELLLYVARRIAQEYGLAEPAEVRWTCSLTDCWAASYAEQRVILVSIDLAQEPDSVLDAVLHHELLHITYGLDCDSPEFAELHRQYPHAVDVSHYLAGRVSGATERA